MPHLRLMMAAALAAAAASAMGAALAGAAWPVSVSASLTALAATAFAVALAAPKTPSPAPAAPAEEVAAEAEEAVEPDAPSALDVAQARTDELTETRKAVLDALNAAQNGDLRRRLASPHDPDVAETYNRAIEEVASAVDEIIALADLLGQGDISTPANGRQQGDLALLRDAFNDTQDGLRDMVASVKTTAQKMKATSADMDAAAGAIHQLSRSQQENVAAVETSSADLARSVAMVGDVAGTVKSEVARAVSVSTAGESARAAAEEAMTRLRSDTREISGALGMISEIAQQTSLLAINASVEAVRAGPAGRGFAVVSDEVKALATRSAQAASDITAIVERVDRAAVDAAARIDECSGLIASMSERVAATQAAAERIESACADQGETLSRTSETIQALVRSATSGAEMAGRAESTAAGLEALSGALAERLDRFRLSDPIMRTAVTERAAELSRRLEAEVNAGRISIDDLFSRDYEPLPGAGPTQYMTPFVPVTDRVFPDVLESALSIHDGVVFSAAVNLDGFLPTHNQKYSQSPGDDPVWNAANARNRRFFNDRVGLAAGQSRAACLVQAYRRDMGGGAYVTMKDISAPIMVRGRHWGGLRIGYKLPSATAAEPALATAL